jgi:UDP-3-O-[3-hydroxymyristoyl] N-acetylglucosamine deacetylase
MLNLFQKTLSKSVVFKGHGLHSGVDSELKIIPAAENFGIVFKRTDLEKDNIVLANYKNVSSAQLCTTLRNEFNVSVSTVEHLLAALYIAGIDNAIIEINNEEVPIMDGSAKDFLEIIKKTKIKTSNKKRKYLRILDKVELIDGERKISIEPNDLSFEVDFQLNYVNEIIGKQKNIVNFQNDDLEEVFTSRTFCLFEDIEKIKKAGLAKGGSLENAVVVDGDKVLNEDGLRNQKEFVNHKILDLAGDFLLSGHRILGKVKCYQGGHELTNKFLRKLLKSKSATSIINLDNIAISKRENSDQSIKLAVNA